MPEFRKVATVDEVPRGELRSVEVGNQKYVIAHTTEGFFAAYDECTHDYAPISNGQLNGTELICPRHHARFDLKTGDVTPPAIVPLDMFEVKIEGNDILLEVDN